MDGIARLSTQMKEFAVPEFKQEIADLKRRLESSILPSIGLETEKDYGVDRTKLLNCAEEWKSSYSFDKWRKKLQKYPHYTTKIDDLDIHFVYIPNERKSRPLLLIHGWPGSFLEFWELIDQLKEYSLVIPSLPGFGFSSAPRKPGFGVSEIASTLNKLMLQLGYVHYTAQGGDWGAIICKALGMNHGDNCKLIHVNMVISGPPLTFKFPFRVFQMIACLFLSAEYVSKLRIATLRDANNIKNNYNFILYEMGYQWIQGTKPDTLAYALTDSPLGLLAWIFEKFHTWGGIDKPSFVFTNTQILDNVTLYFLTRTIGSSIRIYKEHLGTKEIFTIGLAHCKTKTAVTHYSGDIVVLPESWIRDLFNVVYFRSRSGGHFAAMEDPIGLIEDIHNVMNL